MRKLTYTPKIRQAVAFAIEAHMKQKRKSKDVDYIVHPLTVGLVLSSIGADEDTVVAGLLHDTIEDTKVMKEDIAFEFGPQAAEMVEAVSEEDKSLPWKERKEAALRHIPKMSQGALLVKSADILNNMEDFISTYEIQGEEMFAHFSAPKEQQLERYSRAIAALEKAWKGNPLLVSLKAALSKLGKLWG